MRGFWGGKGEVPTGDYLVEYLEEDTQYPLYYDYGVARGRGPLVRHRKIKSKLK